MRKYIVAGNWKMNTGPKAAGELAEAVAKLAGDYPQVEVVVCPPYTSLLPAGKAIENSQVRLGAQDVHWEDDGAYTGKVSLSMLEECGVTHVIVGHSEQRTHFHETDETVNRKAKKVLAGGLTPIVCVGETIEERKAEKTMEVVRTQIKEAYAGIDAAQAQKTVIAYEPVWAIGTGLTATAEQAQEVHAFIRSLLVELFDKNTAEAVRIQYGGSMKPENAEELLKQPDVDGGLIGGASLKPDSFIGIIRAVKA